MLARRFPRGDSARSSVSTNSDARWPERNTLPAAEQSVERVRIATSALEASAERFKVLFEASADPYLILDGDHFSDCNQAAVELLRYRDKEDLLARHPGDLSPNEQPDGESSKDKADSMVTLTHSRGSHRFDWIHRRKDGAELPVEVTLTPIDLDGKPVLLVVWHDLGERIEAEQAMRAAKEIAEESTRAASSMGRTARNRSPATRRNTKMGSGLAWRDNSCVQVSAHYNVRIYVHIKVALHGKPDCQRISVKAQVGA